MNVGQRVVVTRSCSGKGLRDWFKDVAALMAQSITVRVGVINRYLGEGKQSIWWPHSTLIPPASHWWLQWEIF